MSATVRRTQQERRAETERRVLDATRRLVVDRGVRAVTLAGVGVEAGYSRGIVNHAFGTRQALISTLAELLQDRLATEIEPGRHGLERVLNWVGAYLVALQERDEDSRAFLMLWVAALTAEPDLRPIFRARDRHFRQVIAGEIEAGLTDGSIRSDVHPEASALAIVGQLRGIGLLLLLSDERADLGPLRANVLEATRRSLQS